MRRLTLALLLFLASTPLFAAPQITSIEPAEGFVFQPTRVTIRGTDFTDGSIVMFGMAPGIVESSKPTEIVVLAPQQPNGLRVDVLVRTGGQEVVRANGFSYSATARASRADYTQYLVPVIGQAQPGAHGSLWTTEFAFFNPTQWIAPLIAPNCTPNVSPCFPTIGPAVTARMGLWGRSGIDGAFVYVPNRLAQETAMSLRVRDTNQSANFGTEVPVVNVGAEFTNQNRQIIRLLDIPTDPKFRATLRIYSHDQAPQQVNVRVYREDSQIAVSDRPYNLEGIVTAVFEPFPPQPAYLQFDPLTPEVRAAGNRIRIEVHAYQPLLISPPLVAPIWAFVTLTNNETQQVTTVTPNQ